MNKKYLLLSATVLFFLFLVYTYFVAREFLVQFDFDTTVRVQYRVPARVDSVFSALSTVGSFEIITIATALLTLGLSWKRWRRGVIFVMYTVFHVIELIFKTIIDQSAPPFMFHRNTSDFHFPSTYISTDYYSYPSGHTGRAAFLLIIFSFLIGKSSLRSLYKYILIASLNMVFILMFISRVSLGEHWISDVIGGTLLGFSLALVSVVFW